MEKLKELHELANDNAKEAQMRQAKYFNANHRNVQYSIGDLVLKKNRVLSSAVEGVSAKLAPTFNGPFKVSRILSPNIYELADLNGKIDGPSSVEHLKTFHERTSSDMDQEDDGASPEEDDEERNEDDNREDNASDLIRELPKKRGRPEKIASGSTK